MRYQPAFYAPFGPQSVWEMLERTPGFAIVEGDFVRGIAGAGGNVLINGKRPITKADGLYETLRRIPISNVDYIEILRGGQVAEAPGHATVANIVLKTDMRPAGAAELVIERAPHGRWFPNASGNYSRNAGDWRLAIAGSLDWELHPLKGRNVLRDEHGSVTERQIERFPGRFIDSGASGSASGPIAGGDVELSLRYAGADYGTHQTLLSFGDDGGFLSQSRLDVDERSNKIESGADWERSFSEIWSFKLSSLASISEFSFKQREFSQDGRADSYLRQKPIEAVTRATFVREAKNFRTEFGGEAAFNRLKSHLRYIVDDGSGPVPVDLPAANIVASEFRGELFTNLSWTLNPRYSFDAGIAVEGSEIRVKGDADNTDHFVFPKAVRCLELDAESRCSVARRIQAVGRTACI